MRTIDEILANIANLEEDEIEARDALLADIYSTITKGISLNRLIEICKAEQEGRLVILPCKVGDTVYVINGCYAINGFEAECNPEIESKVVDSFSIDESGRILLKLYGGICYADELGKIVGFPFWQGCFLTREEAEAALKGNVERKQGICSPTKLPCSECMPTTCDCETKEE